MIDEEGERLEFKEAKGDYKFSELAKYCTAIANEGGGHMILGVTDHQPRRVVGSNAFRDLNGTKANLCREMGLRIGVDEVEHADGRVLIFRVPPRPLGLPVQYRGAYWMRAGDAPVGMNPQQLRAIFDETGPDFSAETYTGGDITDLDRRAMDLLRDAWARTSANKAILQLDDAQLLKDAELLINGHPCYAALVLLGTRAAVRRHLPQAEVIFEYRLKEESIPYDQRLEFTEGFFLFEQELIAAINSRNDVQRLREGMFRRDIPTFSESVVREAVLNAVSHRDYRLGGSIFIRQFPRRMEVLSPGGLPQGITVDNIMWSQTPRNRRIAEILARCGLVERSGQGIDTMFSESIKQGKAVPDFTGTNQHQVRLTIGGEVQNPHFLRFVGQLGDERLESFSIEDLMVLDLIARGIAISQPLRSRLPRLVDSGVIERRGAGRGIHYILSRELYGYVGQKGKYTRARGLDHETNKALLLQHISEDGADGSRLAELAQVLPFLSRQAVQRLLRELRDEGKIQSIGRTKGARWYLA
jgi:ATP-dependent DNA helicase RecG